MYKILLDLYMDGRLNDDGLEAAVVKGWITKVEKIQIITNN